MDYDRLSALLDNVDVRHFKEGFMSLLSLFPDSSCESVQLVNLLLPLVLDLLRPFYDDNTMVQINLYLYAQVIQFLRFFC